MSLAGGYFSWYSGLWWYDMLMHFTGGIMIGTVAFLFAFSIKFTWFGKPTAPRYGRIVTLILLGIIFWEGMEYGLSLAGGSPFYFLDSLSDILLGLSGALFVLSRSTILESESAA